MTLSLTNRLNRINLYGVFGTLSFIGMMILFARTCNKAPDEEPVYTKLARMGTGINVVDTTKPQVQMKPINHSYSLAGSDTLFNLLWLQLNSPPDVTPRQLNTLKEWIQTNLKQDTTTHLK